MFIQKLINGFGYISIFSIFSLDDYINPYITRIQEKEQHGFFLNLNASNPDKLYNDHDKKDSLSDAPPPKRRHRNKKSDPSSSPSSEDDLASDLKRINDKKDKKLNKDITIATKPFPSRLI